MPALAKRYRCEHQVSGQCSAGQGTPTRVTCRCCGGRILIEYGLWTVREWDLGKRSYYDLKVVREFKTEGAMRRFMDRNSFESWVWHWVRHGEAVVFERPR